MFDSVGRNLDEDANKRGATAVGIIVLLTGATALAIVLAGLWAVREIVREVVEDDAPMLVDLEPEEEADDLLPPPPPPPPPSSGPEEEEEEEEDDAEEEPDELEDVQELEEEVKEEPVKSAERPKGVEGGVEGGQEGGVIGGVLGGVEGGVLGGSLNSGPKVVHHSQVEWKRKVEPRYPMAAKGMGLGEQRCIAEVHIDADGVPTRVSVDRCPKVFHAGTEEALLKWRSYPYKLDGEKITVSVKIAVVYRENG
ncbi:MAG: energy transducer TonB [Alphaproteobacteria bacterium]|nr:energy transducer TonB [Alphaproteobacteria bacterium]